MNLKEEAQEALTRLTVVRRQIELEAAALVAAFDSGEVILIGGHLRLETLRALLRASAVAHRELQAATTEH